MERIKRPVLGTLPQGPIKRNDGRVPAGPSKEGFLVGVVVFVVRVTKKSKLGNKGVTSRTPQCTKENGNDGRMDGMEGRVAREGVDSRISHESRVPPLNGKTAIEKAGGGGSWSDQHSLRKGGCTGFARLPPARMVLIPLTAIVDLDAPRLFSLALTVRTMLRKQMGQLSTREHGGFGGSLNGGECWPFRRNLEIDRWKGREGGQGGKGKGG